MEFYTRQTIYKDSTTESGKYFDTYQEREREKKKQDMKFIISDKSP